MSQLPGFTHKLSPSHVCRLQKAIYGLKQSPPAWFSKMSITLLTVNFHSSRADSSLFIYYSNAAYVFFLIYVDDILVVSSTESLATNFISSLSAQFPVKNLGDVHYFSGIQFTRSSTGFFPNQSSYIRDLLRQLKMENTKPFLNYSYGLQFSE